MATPRGRRATVMQTLLWPAMPHAHFSWSLPICIPFSTPLSTPSSNACRQMISNTESGGESLARPMSRSMDAVSVMGELDDDGEAGTGGWGPLFTVVAGDIICGVAVEFAMEGTFGGV